MSENNLCVLSTCSDDIPDASLMLYMCDSPCAKIYMLTLKETNKYRNIVNNKRVSLLIDTRDTVPDKTSQIEALTIVGEAMIVRDMVFAQTLIEQMKKKHHSLSNLASGESVSVIEVTVQTILFLENVDDGYNVNMDDD
jgi:general stress protein 26